MKPPKLTGTYRMAKPRQPHVAKKRAEGGSRALGRLPPGVMNKTEASYSAYLEGLRRSGDIVWFRFEPLKLRIAKATFYEPDFLVMRADGTLEFHEVKGRWEDDARVKIKVAAEAFGIFLFVAVTVDKSSSTGWKEERFGW